jgi:hypothetical protein
MTPSPDLAFGVCLTDGLPEGSTVKHQTSPLLLS